MRSSSPSDSDSGSDRNPEADSDPQTPPVTADGATATRALALSGDRHQIRVATVEQALGLLVGMLREDKL